MNQGISHIVKHFAVVRLQEIIILSALLDISCSHMLNGSAVATIKSSRAVKCTLRSFQHLLL